MESTDEYENIFIGYPIWWGTMPMAMFTQLEKLDFKGKNVIPFSTHEGSGLGSSMRDVEKLCLGATIQSGLAIVGSQVQTSKDRIAIWAKKSVR